MIITLIGEDGIKIGEVSKDEAEKMAKGLGRVLVVVDAKNSIYKIADNGRLKYEQRQKEKAQRAQQRSHKIKEIQVSPVIGEHDLNIKIDHAKEFLRKGMKTKLTMKFKRRQITHPEIGVQKMNHVIESILSDGNAEIDKLPIFDGKDLIAFLIPKKR